MCDTREVNGSAGVEDEDHGGGCERPEHGNDPVRIGMLAMCRFVKCGDRRSI